MLHSQPSSAARLPHKVVGGDEADGVLPQDHRLRRAQERHRLLHKRLGGGDGLRRAGREAGLGLGRVLDVSSAARAQAQAQVSAAGEAQGCGPWAPRRAPTCSVPSTRGLAAEVSTPEALSTRSASFRPVCSGEQGVGGGQGVRGERCGLGTGEAGCATRPLALAIPPSLCARRARAGRRAPRTFTTGVALSTAALTPSLTTGAAVSTADLTTGATCRPRGAGAGAGQHGTGCCAACQASPPAPRAAGRAHCPACPAPQPCAHPPIRT